MATGFVQRFKGKVQAASLWLGNSGFYDAPSGVAGITDFMLKVPLPVTATANTDFSISLPPGGAIIAATVFTTVAYGAVTDCKISLGTSAGDNSYLSGGTTVSVKALGVYVLTLVQPGAAGPALMPNASPNLYIRLVQTGTASATGTAFLIINYSAM